MFVLGVLVVIVLVGAFALLWRESLLLTNPPGYSHPRRPGFKYDTTPKSLYGIDFEELEMAAPQGGMVRGWLTPARDGSQNLAVVAVHGRGGDRTNYLRQLPVLRDAGAAVALIDLRENGLSDGNGRGAALGMREAEDALIAAANLRERGYAKVVLMGCSLGASAAMIAAARDPAIAGVIAESPLESFAAYVRDSAEARFRGRALPVAWISPAWGQAVVSITRLRLGLNHFEDPINVVANIAPRPVLIVHGLDDTIVPVSHAKHLAERAGSGAVFAAIPGGGHCDSFDISPEAYSRQVRSLLASAVSS